MSLLHDEMREKIKELVDKIDADKLKKYYEQLRIDAIPEEDPTPEEIEAIRKGREQFEKGEYRSFEDVFNELEEDDE